MFGRGWAVAAFFLALVLILKLPVLNTPHFWDAMNRVQNAEWVRTHGFNPFLEKGEGPLAAQGRPPLFFIALALAWSAFGSSLAVSHLFILVFSFLGILFTYFLGRDLVHPRAGILAALALFFSPLYFAQSGILNLEIPVTALTLMAVFFALKERRFAYVLSAAALVLTKETGFLILIPLALAMGFRGHQRGSFFKAALFYASPVLFYLAWLVACRLVLGWFLFPAHVSIINLASVSHLARVGLDRLAQLLFRNGHGILCLVIAAGAWSARKEFPWAGSGLPLFFGVLAVYVLFFSFYSIPLDRYLLPVYPFFFLVFSWAVERWSASKTIPAAIALAAVVSLFVFQWRGERPGPGFALESNLEYLDFIEAHAAAVSLLEQRFPEATVLTHWPQTMELRYPRQGYATRPLRAFGILEKYDPRQIDLVYFIPDSQPEFAAAIKNFDLEPIAAFEKSGKRAVISRLRHKPREGGS